MVIKIEVKSDNKEQAQYVNRLKQFVIKGFIENPMDDNSMTKLSKSCSIKVTESPTNNCQLSTIGPFNSLLAYFNKKEILEILQEIHFAHMNLTKMLFIDVVSGNSNRTKDVFGKGIYKELSYVNTRGTDMVIYLVKLEQVEGFTYLKPKI